MKYFKYSIRLFALLLMITNMMYVGCQKDEQKNLKSDDQLCTDGLGIYSYKFIKQ